MATTKWVLDPTHSELGFKIKHLMITNVSGNFKSFDAQVETENEDFSTARLEVTADMASINTNNEQRDAHLRNSDFFETDKYPALNFRSTRIERVDSETFTLYGDLTLKGITKAVKLNVEYSGLAKDPWGNEKAGFVVTGKINRSDWGINFNGVLETGGLMLGEEVKINAEIQLVKQAATVAA
ncbi:YceI family protein [Paraflavisolibacter sp. H34]|uniref:YceI family protein n=1 Tax=Huijunlia imazamoxiresistens TaxID=3127457 RepID=UPI0030189A40